MSKVDSVETKCSTVEGSKTMISGRDPGFGSDQGATISTDKIQQVVSMMMLEDSDEYDYEKMWTGVSARVVLTQRIHRMHHRGQQGFSRETSNKATS